ncbi:hypothetical protein [Amycolatopsis sp. NPDC057786]|uniref:hypothetical protein n=1 Tax=Amycolatopsis sp. NPDC057786 TaxID=3346250 RepID=UPI00366B160C
MAALKRQQYTIEVYPGLFYLANAQPVGEHDPSDLVSELDVDNAVCLFGDNGITFNSSFQSHLTEVTVEFLAAGAENHDAADDVTAEPAVRTVTGRVVLREGGLLFANPDQVMPEKAVDPPYFGICHARVTRRLLRAPETYAPSAAETNPVGLEEWVVAFWQAISDVDRR